MVSIFTTDDCRSVSHSWLGSCRIMLSGNSFGLCLECLSFLSISECLKYMSLSKSISNYSTLGKYLNYHFSFLDLAYVIGQPLTGCVSFGKGSYFTSFRLNFLTYKVRIITPSSQNIYENQIK